MRPGVTDSKTHNSVYKTWVSKGLIPDTEPETIYDHRKKIEAFIRDHPSYAEGTKKQLYLSLGNAMKLVKKPVTAQKYIDLAIAINKATDEAYASNTRTAKQEASSTWSEIRATFNQLKGTGQVDLATDHAMLLTGLNTYQPPLRLEPATMAVESSEYQKGKLPETNCVIRKAGRWYYYLTDYKTFKSYGPKAIKMSESASSILDDSLKRFPRKFLYRSTRSADLPIGRQGYSSLIKRTLGPANSANTLRSAYASHLINSNPSQQVKGLVAKSMGTSTEMLDKVYRKLDQPSSAKVDLDSVSETMTDYQPKPRGRPKTGESVSKADYAKKYYETNKLKRAKQNAEYFQKKKSTIAARITAKRAEGGANVSERTLQKHGLI